jgi:hypothetical protein
MTIEFRVLGIVGVGLSVTGNLAYSTQVIKNPFIVVPKKNN